MLDKEELADLRRAFACDDLGLAMSDATNARRERLAVIMLSFAKGGERDPDAIRALAVRQMKGKSRGHAPDAVRIDPAYDKTPPHGLSEGYRPKIRRVRHR
jgi:hypothetical protein